VEEDWNNSFRILQKRLQAMMDPFFCGSDRNPSYCFVSGELAKSGMIVKIRITHPSNLLFDFSEISSRLSEKGYDIDHIDRRNDEQSPFSPGDEWWIAKKLATSVGKPFSSLINAFS
jgi:hypothetical protein